MSVHAVNLLFNFLYLLFILFFILVHSVYSFTHLSLAFFLMCLSYCFVSVLFVSPMWTVLLPLGQVIIVNDNCFSMDFTLLNYGHIYSSSVRFR